jgi:hypothetical protein
MQCRLVICESVGCVTAYKSIAAGAMHGDYMSHEGSYFSAMTRSMSSISRGTSLKISQPFSVMRTSSCEAHRAET